MIENWSYEINKEQVVVLQYQKQGKKFTNTLCSSIDVKTNRGENFIFENYDLSDTIIFSYGTNIEFLKHLDKVYVDGTFNYCEKHFTQLYTVYGSKINI